MSSDSEDCEDQVYLGRIRPTLIEELRKILELYPDDGQILKELIQNAEDAGASVVQVLTDRRRFNQDIDSHTLKRHPHLRFFKGPALCAYNDAEFTPSDWESVRMLHTSIKEKDPLKVGRFGLGFKSVFHLTDCLVIVSGDHMMYMDPYESEDRYCKWGPVAGRKGRELQSILHSLRGAFGITEQTFAKGGRFPGTVFWLPLRLCASDLSATLYVDENVENLLASFKTEAPSLLLFLKHVHRVQIMARDDSRHPQERFSVGVAPACLTAIQNERDRFVRDITSAGKGLPPRETFCVTEVVMETTETSQMRSARWLVVTYHSGQGQISPALLRLCSDRDLGYRPYVGVAVPLTNGDGFQSQVFCFLPLPLDTRSPTGLPVHVHGYFALEPNRRHLKWPPADQRTSDPAFEWNCLLVREVLPLVYRKALCRLAELCGDEPATLYRAWPDVSQVQDRWKPLLHPLFSSLTQDPVFFSSNLGAQRLHLQNGVLPSSDPRFSQEVKASVGRVYTASEQPIMQLPQHVVDGLEDLGFLQDVLVMNARRVAQLVPHCVSRLERGDRLNVMHYLSHHNARLLLNLPLLPLGDGVSFGTFRPASAKQSTLLCSRELIDLFPGLEDQFCDASVSVRDDLQQLAKSGAVSVEELGGSDPRVPALLEQSVQARCGGEETPPVVEASDPWLQRVWHFLASAGDLSPFSHVPLLPLVTDGNGVFLLPLRGRYRYVSCVDGPSPLSGDMAGVLSKLGVRLLHALPDYVTGCPGMMGNFVKDSSMQGVLATLESVSHDPSLRDDAVRGFNATAMADEKAALLQFVSLVGNSSTDALVSLLRQLTLFKEAYTGRSVSVSEVSRIGPSSLLPVDPPMLLLGCNALERRAALCLRAKEVSVLQVAGTILDVMCRGRNAYSEQEIVRFMAFFLQSEDLLSEPRLTPLCRSLPFVTTQCGRLQVPATLYDPSSPLLQHLLASQRQTKFPCGEFAEPEMLRKLKKLGLGSESDVTSDDLIAAATAVADLWQGRDEDSAVKSAEALFRYLNAYGDEISSDTLTAISSIQCLPCLQDGDKPDHYPQSLAVRACPRLVRPRDLYSYSLLAVTGSVAPVCRPHLSAHLAARCVRQEAATADVLQHLKNVTAQFQQWEISQYKMVLNKIFQHLARNSSDLEVIKFLRREKCILRETGESFSQPAHFWLQRRDGDIDLRPYRFALPVELQPVQGLLRQCGSVDSQSELMLQAVLREIERRHQDPSISPSQQASDLRLVQRLVEVLRKSPSGRDGNTLLPVLHPHSSALSFKPANECTVIPGIGLSDVPPNVGFEIHIVHPDIPAQTALDLGACQIQERALTGLEDLDFGYEQREELMDRLHRLLEDSYTDGFSVPKELVQNADDACASRVSFLLDERENVDCRTNLITDAMASLQGPAIWVYNDAMFSPADFRNITRLGAETKKDDVSKVGKFGLGFNSVYNLTDVPFFISGHVLAMFDPQVRYLRKGAGLKLDFSKAINKALLSSMPQQFQPFHNIFGCSLRGPDVDYRGTLFRFPLRTPEQAEDNKLKSESYSESKRRDFLQMLLEKAGSLLLFSQNVQEIEVFHLPRNCADVTNPTRLLTVRKTCSAALVSPSEVSLNEQSVLRFVKDHWLRQTDIRVQQRLQVEMAVTAAASKVCGVAPTRSVTQWHVAWASGTEQSARKALERSEEGLVPLAAAAVSFCDAGLIPLRDSPLGFYTTGHLFCFLPLPQSPDVAEAMLPVHLNATFALTSSRRGLKVQTEDELKSEGSSWNTALYSDAVCRAYLLLLQQVRQEAVQDRQFGRFFHLWPTGGLPCLVNSFYRHLETDGDPVLPVSGHDNTWVSFNQARFLDPLFRDSPCGSVAWTALHRLWRGPDYLVDVPAHLCQLMKDNCSPGAFAEKVITELAFYRDFFFPNLQCEWWKVEERDGLIHHAVMRNNKDMAQLIRGHACIPCQGGRLLRKPEELVSPKGRAAKLFLMSEQRFPQAAAAAQESTEMAGAQESTEMAGAQESTETAGGEPTEIIVDFCSKTTRQRLSKLGMVTDVLPWDMLLDRARSVGSLIAHETEEALRRAGHLIDYLSVSTDGPFRLSLENCPSDVRQSLSQTAFLPVLRKPSDWPFPWAGDEAVDSLLAPPAALCLDTLRNLVACQRKLLDVAALKPTEKILRSQTRRVLELLGVVVSKDYFNTDFLQHVVDQLIAVSDHHNTCPGHSDHHNTCPGNKELSQAISRDIYAYLNTCLGKSPQSTVGDKAQATETETSVQAMLCSRLTDRRVVWTDGRFVQPSVVAVYCPYKCSPHLMELETHHKTRYRAFFKAVGVRERFTFDGVLRVLEKLKGENQRVQLAEETVNVVCQMAELLASMVRSPPRGSEELDKGRVFLPDAQGFMHAAADLCVDDCPTLKETGPMRFVSDRIAKETARLLGVRTKQRQHFSLMTTSIAWRGFGPSEKLTNRIRGLLQGYTLDSSLWKELLQNAEDAGATEARFLMDFRDLPTQRVPDHCQCLQGPALCFYNNRSFTARDMEGIQDLGVGGKRGQDVKIGRFGVGFCAVFHLTDTPSFWTRVDDREDVVCVWDPNCRHLPDVQPDKPGIQFTDVQQVRRSYPDFWSGYLDDGVIDKTQPGTLFRFPLRTERMAEMSEIKKEAVTQAEVRNLLGEFQKEVGTCLMFLTSLKTVGIYSVCEDGSVSKEFEVNKTVDEASCQELDRFKTALQRASVRNKQSSTNVKDVPVCQSTVRSQIVDSAGGSEDWLIVHRVGFASSLGLSTELEQKWDQDYRMLPQGGVAVRLKAESVKAASVKAERLKAKRLKAKRLKAKAKRVKAERLKAASVEAERVEAANVEAKRMKAERLKAERVEAASVEAERVEAASVEAERVEAASVKAERVEAASVEAERVKAERVEATSVKAERVEAASVEAERVEAESVKAASVKTESPGKTSQSHHAAFCMLPLPGHTGLPMHVNGHFALGNETRRNLWVGSGDVKSEWNAAIALQVIVPAYITALQRAKDLLFAERGQTHSRASALEQYHGLFPRRQGDPLWDEMVQQLYRAIAEEELLLFPMMCAHTQRLQWLPAVRKEGFPGYFNTLPNIYSQEQEGSRSVVLTGGLSTSSGRPSAPSPQDAAREMRELLKRLNMKILEAPLQIIKNFRASGVHGVLEVTADSVLDFLGSAGHHTGTGCNLHSLPRPVSDSPLGSAGEVLRVVRLVSQSPTFRSQLQGLPLCLRQSDVLHTFSAACAVPPIMSRYYYLLPGSAEEFLHRSIIPFFTDLSKTEGVLQTLSISGFASRLHQSLTEPCLRVGRPCALEQNRLPSLPDGKSWLRKVWTFLEEELQKQIQQEETFQDSVSSSHVDWKKDSVRQKAEETLRDCLGEWCLIPVDKTEGGQAQEMVYPVKDLRTVVYLSPRPDQTNTSLWHVLKKFPLPFLNTLHLPVLTPLSSLVASLSHPRALLHALASCATVLAASHEEGHEILEYFSKTLEVLKSGEDVVQLKKELRSLPVFPAVGESLVSLPASAQVLCVNASVPEDGLPQWSCNQQIHLHILRASYVPRVLQEFLGFKHVKDDHFYSHYLLPSLQVLPREAILRHMTFLRDNIDRNIPEDPQELLEQNNPDLQELLEQNNPDLQELLKQLTRTAFVSVHGTLHRAEEFFSPHIPVFTAMHLMHQFPPEPYHQPDWKQFMTVAGMRAKVTSAMFLDYARAVEQQGRRGITDDVVRKSETLVHHLFHREHLTQDRLLSDLKDVRFLVPLKWRSIPQNQQLEIIAKPLHPARLVSFSESALEHHRHLVWSSSWILAQYADPRKHIHDGSVSRVLNLLGVGKDPPKEKVLQHLENMAQTLSGENGCEVFASLQPSECLLIKIMETVYKFLDRNISRIDIPDLAEVPLVCDIEGRQMLKPINVVLDLQPQHIIKGHVDRAPLFGRYAELFRRLGAAPCVTANHYARFLAWQKTESGDTPLHVEEVKLVKTALEGLFYCLREGSEEQRAIAVDTLYLPTQEQILRKSTEIVYKDGRFGRRFLEWPENMHFFLGFWKLEMRVMTPLEEIELLPPHHQMDRLSRIVREVIPEDISRNASEGIQSRELTARLQNPLTKDAIVRLVYHECRQSERSFNDESAREVRRKLSNVIIKQISGLRTVLWLHDQEIQGSESAATELSFIEKTEEPQRRAGVYIDVERSEEIPHGSDPFLRSIAEAVNYVLETDLEKFHLTDILQNPWVARNILDIANIDECDFSATTEDISAIPPPGTEIPESQHCYLDNSFHHFSPGEHVGYEQYDPAVANPEEGYPDPLYIYAVVIEEVSINGEEDVPLLARHYRIYLGPAYGEVQVPVIRLYKFFRRGNEHLPEPRDVVLRDRAQAGADDGQPCPDRRTVLREIRVNLSDAWRQYSDPSDRRRVVKRLVLKWHPAKNPDRKEFCTYVTQKIFHYEELLNEGRALPTDDDDEDVSSPRSSDSMFRSPFYAHMSSRARTHQEYYESASSSDSYDYQQQRNPKPGEAKRWFRQAKADVTAAQATKGLCDRGHNWTCYLCHQAVEKAMKAVIYFRDANCSILLSHDLPQLAVFVGDADILSMAREVESRIGRHTRMRYPDVQVYPRIPADVYTEEDGRWACDIATRVLQRVEGLIEV